MGSDDGGETTDTVVAADAAVEQKEEQNKKEDSQDSTEGGERNEEIPNGEGEEEEEEKAEEEKQGEESAVVVKGKCILPDEKPEGVEAMMISIKNMEKYELKNGEGIKDTVEYKWFNKEEIMEEIKAVGFYSDFNDFKKQIQEYGGDELLVIADPDEKYGQNWVLCTTPAAAEEMFELLTAEQTRIKEEQRRIREEEERKRAAEEAERNIVYEDKPIIPGERVSYTDAETREEIEWLDVKASRKLLCMTITRKRSDFGAQIKLVDRDSEQSGIFEFRQHKDPNFELKRKQIDVGLQACPSWTATWIPQSPWAKEGSQNHKEATDDNDGKGGEDKENEQDEEDDDFNPAFSVSKVVAAQGGKKSTATGIFDFCAENLTPNDQDSYREIPRVVDGSSQTSFHRKLNQTTQSEYVELTEEEKQDIEERQVAKFLKDVLPTMEFALQQNETLDVFANEFLSLRNEEATGLGNQEDNFLRELRTFTDLVYSNGKMLSSVDWHPRLSNVVAVACSEPLKFDQRVEFSGKEKNSFILIWNFADLIHPQLVLQSPHECTHFCFNPDQPHLIAGGCVTGQVVLWDISKAQAQLRRKKEGGGAGAGKQSKQGEGDQASSSASTKNVDESVIAEKGGKNNGDENLQKEEAGASSSAASHTNNIAPVEPLVISVIDQSHKRPISHIEWIPHSLHVNSLGKIKTNVKSGNNEKRFSHQLVTCAGDGRMMFWDTRFNSFKRVKQASPEEEGSESLQTDEMHWTPMFKCALQKDEGTGDYALSKIALRGRLDLVLENLAALKDSEATAAAAASSSSSSSPVTSNQLSTNGLNISGTVFSCTTEDGDMIFADWNGAKAQKSARAGESNKKENQASNNSASRTENGSTTNTSSDERIHWISTDHFRNCLALKRSPFFPFLILSVSANGFNIWKEDLDRPLFSSPMATGMSHLTCAEWSPTRPAVIIVGKSDGAVDIWDLTDQSHRPSASVPIGAYAITSMAFRNVNNVAARRNVSKPKKLVNSKDEKHLREVLVSQSVASAPTGTDSQLLALGDAAGNLHIQEIPHNLRWRSQNEAMITLALFERELQRVEYVTRQSRIREQERYGISSSSGNNNDPISSSSTTPSSSSSSSSNPALASANALALFEDSEKLDRDSKEYKKLVEAEEKRYRALSAKLLSDDLHK